MSTELAELFPRREFSRCLAAASRRTKTGPVAT